MYKELLKDVFTKYGYNDNEQTALALAFEAMVSVYGEKEIPDIIQMFMSLPIYFSTQMSEDYFEEIHKKELNGRNAHIVYKNHINPYGVDTTPGSLYHFETIFTKDMQPCGSSIYLIVKDMVNDYQKDGYLKVFGTTINVPYLIHELNHAYAMQKPLVNVEGNKIYEKYGMFITQSSFVKNGSVFEVEEESSEDVVLEEAINELLSEKMLVNVLHLKDEAELLELLRSIKHVTSSYGPIIKYALDRVESIFGDKLMAYRKSNDFTFYNEFNEMASSGEIYKKYMEGKLPFEVFSHYLKESFMLTAKCYTYPLETYKRLQQENLIELLAPLYALKEAQGTSSLEDYEKYRETYGTKKDSSVR